jgi:hypothetical protein
MSGLICAAENRERYPATCWLMDEHSGLAWGLYVGPAVLVLLMAIAEASSRTARIVSGLSAAFWAGYVVSLLMT